MENVDKRFYDYDPDKNWEDISKVLHLFLNFFTIFIHKSVIKLPTFQPIVVVNCYLLLILKVGDGLRNLYICCCYASRLMTKQQMSTRQTGGLIINIGSNSGLQYLSSMAHNVGKVAVDRMSKGNIETVLNLITQ